MANAPSLSSTSGLVIEPQQMRLKIGYNLYDPSTFNLDNDDSKTWTKLRLNRLKPEWKIKGFRLIGMKHGPVLIAS